ncbi:hypothetical protein CFP56_022344 [Quercus suber]|uniref:Uncharacterized protein n=1 Tax=Quercus suber TaxID=58331 RepID=A0AAW0KBZ2_QUESU
MCKSCRPALLRIKYMLSGILVHSLVFAIAVGRNGQYV